MICKKMVRIYRILFFMSIAIHGIPQAGRSQTGNIWRPLKGTIILGGGHISEETAKDFARQLIKLAGGPDSLIVIIPTANPHADTIELRQWLTGEGANNVAILNARSRADANSHSFVKILQSAKAVFITGGQPMVLEKIYRGTLVEDQLKALLLRGGV